MDNTSWTLIITPEDIARLITEWSLMTSIISYDYIIYVLLKSQEGRKVMKRQSFISQRANL